MFVTTVVTGLNVVSDKRVTVRQTCSVCKTNVTSGDQWANVLARMAPADSDLKIINNSSFS